MGRLERRRTDRSAWACALWLLSSGAGVLADVIDTSGQAPYEACAYCHGLDGNSATERFPKLAGQPKDYLLKQLRDFRSGRRSDEGVMREAIEQVPEEAMEQVAEYFSGQPRPGGSGARSVHSRETPGKALYNRGRQGVAACSACHGQPGYPWLLGQHRSYLERQMLAFHASERRNDPDGVMRQIVQALTRDEIRQVAEYAAHSW